MGTKLSLSQPVTQRQWNDIEKYYTEEIAKIVIPEDPLPHDITQLNARLANLFHEARLDYHYASKTFDNVKSGYKKLKRALYPIVKSGRNGEERDHMMQEHLMKTTLDQLDQNTIQILKLPSSPVTIYELYDVYEERVDFIKSVIDIIADKTSRLITDNEAIKVDARLSPR